MLADDEFHAGQPDAVVRQHRGAGRRDRGRPRLTMISVFGRGTSAERDVGDFERDGAFIDMTGLAVRAGNASPCARPSAWRSLLPSPRRRERRVRARRSRRGRCGRRGSVTIAAAVFMTGSQSGVVVSATRISPGWKRARSSGPETTRTRPLAIFSPTARRRQQRAAAGLQRIGLDRSAAAAGGDGLGAGLDDIEPSVLAVLRPLDVHRRRMAGLTFE